MDKPRKLSRNEHKEVVKQRLLNAAAQIVGELGYAEASVARITERASVANGTFYKHFESRQALLNDLLPALGKQMTHYIKEQTEAIRPEAKRESARFKAFFDYLRENPNFTRILNEAEFAAPEAYRQHIENMAAPFQRIIQRARERGEIVDYTDSEIEVIVHMLMGARSYLSQRYSSTMALEDHVLSAYTKLLGGGLFA